MRERTICAVCDDALAVRWTDTHGVGACTRCGAPYKIYHYEDDKRVDRPPLLLLRDEWVSVLRRYWAECGRNVDPGAFNIPGSSYEVATREDVETLGSWLAADPEAVRLRQESADLPDPVPPQTVRGKAVQW